MRARSRPIRSARTASCWWWRATIRSPRLRVQLRSFDSVCRLVECHVGIGIVPETTARRVERTMAITRVVLTDAWAERELTICIRSLEALPAYARQLVQHLRTDV